MRPVALHMASERKVAEVDDGWYLKIEQTDTSIPECKIRFSYGPYSSIREFYHLYSVDDGGWALYDDNATITFTNNIRFKANVDMSTLSNSLNQYRFYRGADFNTLCKLKVSGSLAAMISKNRESARSLSLSDYTFSQLFQNNVDIVDASELDLGIRNEDNTLAIESVPNYAFYYMFGGCSNLSSPPTEIPYTSLGNSCCRGMFDNSGITYAPEILATTAGENCFTYMFDGCSKLTTPPSRIRVTSLNNSTCSYMFRDCTEMTKAPILDFTSVALRSCYYMFYRCSKIPSIILNVTDLIESDNSFFRMFEWCSALSSITTKQTSFNGCNSWVSAVNSTGTFTCPSVLGDNDSIARGPHACPTRWTVVNA